MKNWQLKAKGAIQIQALYKQALCFIKVAEKSEDPLQSSKATEKAIDVLSKIIFQTNDADKSSPYYFSRSCYNLGQLFVKNEQELSAKAVYKKLLEAKTPGYADAKIILRKLNQKTE